MTCAPVLGFVACLLHVDDACVDSYLVLRSSAAVALVPASCHSVLFTSPVCSLLDRFWATQATGPAGRRQRGSTPPSRPSWAWSHRTSASASSCWAALGRTWPRTDPRAALWQTRSSGSSAARCLLSPKHPDICLGVFLLGRSGRITALCRSSRGPVADKRSRGSALQALVL